MLRQMAPRTNDRRMTCIIITIKNSTASKINRCRLGFLDAGQSAGGPEKRCDYENNDALGRSDVPEQIKYVIHCGYSRHIMNLQATTLPRLFVRRLRDPDAFARRMTNELLDHFPCLVIRELLRWGFHEVRGGAVHAASKSAFQRQ